MKNDRAIQRVTPEVLPPESVENDVFVQRNQHGKVVNQYSITRIDGKTYRTQEQVIHQEPSQFGYWLQVVGAVAIGMVGLYLLVWAIGFVMKGNDGSDRSERLEVVRNV